MMVAGVLQIFLKNETTRMRRVSHGLQEGMILPGLSLKLIHI
jgi:hypothetical protein